MPKIAKPALMCSRRARRLQQMLPREVQVQAIGRRNLFALGWILSVLRSCVGRQQRRKNSETEKAKHVAPSPLLSKLKGKSHDFPVIHFS
jgi:hypothetical protein